MGNSNLNRLSGGPSEKTEKLTDSDHKIYEDNVNRTRFHRELHNTTVTEGW